MEKLIEYMSFKTYHESVRGVKEEISVNDLLHGTYTPRDRVRIVSSNSPFCQEL